MEATPWYHPPADTSWDRKMLRTIATVVLTVLILWLIYRLRTPLLWLVIALFLAIAASGPVNVLSRWMKRNFAVAIVYVLILLLPIAIGAVLLPPLVTSGVNLVKDLPTYINDFQNTLEKDDRFRRIDDNFGISTKLNDLADDLSGKKKTKENASSPIDAVNGTTVVTSAQTLASIGSTVISSIFAAFLIYILSMFMVSRGRGWIDMAIKRRAGPEAEALDRTVDRIGIAVGGYMGGAILQALIAGIAAFVVLEILGTPSPLVLAVIVAIFDLIPLVGATIAGLIVGTITLFAGSAIDAIIWGAFVIAYQQFENYVVQPRIQARAVRMEAFVILVAVLFGGTLMGVLGAILAIPVAATIQITFQEYARFKAEVDPVPPKVTSEGPDDGSDPEPAPA
jgi:predicted PurR-regulated permease PerM